MAVVLLFSTEFPAAGPRHARRDPRSSTPACLSLALVARGAGGRGRPGRRSAGSGPRFAGLGILLIAWALAFQVTGVDLVALLAVLLPAGVILDRGLARLPEDARFATMSGLVPFELSATAGGARRVDGAAALYAVVTFLDPTGWGQVTPPSAAVHATSVPLVAALLAGTALAAARWLAPMALRRIARHRRDRRGRLGRPVRGLRRHGGRAVGRAGGRRPGRGALGPPGRRPRTRPGLDPVDRRCGGGRSGSWPAPTGCGSWTPPSRSGSAPRPVAARVRVPSPSGRTWPPRHPVVRRVADVARGDVRASCSCTRCPSRSSTSSSARSAGSTAVEELAKQAQIALTVTWTLHRRGGAGRRPRPAPPDAATCRLRPARARDREGRRHRPRLAWTWPTGPLVLAGVGLLLLVSRLPVDALPGTALRGHAGSREDRTRPPDRGRARGVVAGTGRHHARTP